MLRELTGMAWPYTQREAVIRDNIDNKPAVRAKIFQQQKPK